MKIIHKYVLREHAGPLIFALSALTSIMLLNYVAKQLGNLVGKGLDWTVILEFFLLSIPFTVAMTLPMAVLVAVLYAFSRLAAENEITALKANGVSMTRLLVPVLIAGAMLSVTMVVFNDQVLPRSNHRLRTLQGDIARKKPTFAIKEQIINEVAPNSYFLRTNHLNRETNGMREVTIYDLSDPMRRRTIYADSGSMAFSDGGADLQLVLYDGFMQEVPKETPTQLQRLYFKVDLLRVPGVGNAFERDSTDTYKSDREMSVCELQTEVARYERDYFRSYDDFQRASATMRQNPKGTMGLVQTALPDPLGASPPRSRVRSLGRSYCDAKAYLQTLPIGRGSLKALRRATALIAPRELFASPVAQASRDQQGQGQQPPPKKPPQPPKAPVKAPMQGPPVQVPAQAPVQGPVKPSPVPALPAPLSSNVGQKVGAASGGPDTVKRDSLPRPAGAATQDTNAKIAPVEVTADSARRRDDALLRAAAGDSAARAAGTAGTGTVPPTYVPGTLLPPSAGGGVTQAATVVMETARSQMLTARTQINQFAVEIQKKFAISMACVIFVLLGAPIALRFPRGGVGLTIGVSLGVFGLYYVGLIAGEALADRSILTPFWAMWSANILFTLVAAILLARMGRETATSRGGDITELLDAFRGLFRPRRGEGA